MREIDFLEFFWFVEGDFRELAEKAHFRSAGQLKVLLLGLMLRAEWGVEVFYYEKV